MKHTIGFLLALLVFFWQKTIYPYLTLSAFAPLMGIYILSFKREKLLWLALIIGLFIDLFASAKMGVWTLNFCISAFILFRFKIHFYKDKPLHVGIFTAIFSSVSTILHFFFSFLFDRSIPISGKWIFTDCIMMPTIDGVYAIVWFFISFWTCENIKFNLFKIRKR